MQPAPKPHPDDQAGPAALVPRDLDLAPPRAGAMRSLPPGHATSPEGRSRIPVLLQLRHAAVPGRARIHVGGLKGAEPIKSLLERGLRAASGIHGAEASALTGNLLVRFDPAMPLETVLARITGLLRGEIAPPEDEHSADPHTAAWHRLNASDLTAALGSSASHGLPGALARERLASTGHNTIPSPIERSSVSLLLGQFQSLPVGLLVVASVISIATGAAVEAAAIMSVVALNGVIGYLTESRAERTIRSLGALEAPNAHLIRDGAAIETPAETVVPGDILVLSRGVMVPADARLISAIALTASEAGLTGESLPVTKTTELIDRANVPLGDRINMVYRGTIITGGTGRAVVVATGLSTEVGRIQRLIGAAAPPQTPMQKQLDGLGQQIVWLAAGVSGLVFGVGWLRGFALFQMFRSALSLAVAAVPEGLPTVATTILALGIDDMRRRNVIIRRLDAVETLAAATVVCFDKTGTLTRNEMQVTTMACGARTLRIVDDPLALQTDPLVTRLLETGALCSEAVVEDLGGTRIVSGSSTESALVQAALDRGIDVQALRGRFPRLSIQHRTEAYRFMATVHDGGNDRGLVAVKGSPLEVLERCRWEASSDGSRSPLTPARRAAIERINADMADQALRVLGFADRELDGSAQDHGERSAKDLTWIGLIGLADPVRDGMEELIARLQRAGLRTVIMTGDQSATARAVANQLGLGGDVSPEIVDAGDLSRLSPDEITAAARRAHVFARVSPEQKLRIIRALQGSGDVVAMIGDGVNDSPALRAADIGIALGQGGTSAAREVADVVLETDDLSTLLIAIERGRTTYTNVRKAIHYLLSTNLSEIVVMIAATAAGVSEALSPMQLLWINLVSDVLPGLGLALEPPEPDVLEHAPRDGDAPIVSRADVRPLATEAAILSAGALGACTYGALRYGSASAQTRTMTFGSLVTAQLLHAFTCRSSQHTVFSAERLPPNQALTRALAASSGLQLAAFTIPALRALLGLTPLSLLDMAVTLAGGVLPFVAGEARKAGQLPLGSRPQGWD